MHPPAASAFMPKWRFRACRQTYGTSPRRRQCWRRRHGWRGCNLSRGATPTWVCFGFRHGALIRRERWISTSSSQMTRRRRWTWRRRCRKWCILMSTLSPTPLLVSTWSLATLDFRCPTPRAGDGDERGGAGNGGAAAWPTRRHYPYTPGTPDLLRGSVGGVSGGSMAPTCDMGGRTLASGVVIAALPPPWLELDHDELERGKAVGGVGAKSEKEDSGRWLRRLALTHCHRQQLAAQWSQARFRHRWLINIGDQVEFTTARVAAGRAGDRGARRKMRSGPSWCAWGRFGLEWSWSFPLHVRRRLRHAKDARSRKLGFTDAGTYRSFCHQSCFASAASAVALAFCIDLVS